MGHISFWLMPSNIETIKKNTYILIDASKEVGLEINVEKTKYMLVSHDQNADHNQDIQIANRVFKHVTVQIFGNDRNKSKFDSGGNYEKTEFW
jgi:hypothetical protein